MADCKPAPTPLPEKMVLHAPTDDEVCEACSYPSLQVIGSVMYAMLGTRPDIAYAISTLSCFASHPGSPHVHALKHLLWYLKGSADYGIVYLCDGGSLVGCEVTLDNDIYGFTDSDYAMDPNTHHSVSRAIFLLTGGPSLGAPDCNPVSPNLPPKPNMLHLLKQQRRPYGSDDSCMTSNRTSANQLPSLLITTVLIYLPKIL